MPKNTARKGAKSSVTRLRIVKGGREAPRTKEGAAEPAAAAASKEKKASYGKRVQFDPETWHALNLLGRDRMMTFQEMADEAFADLLSKHGRPRDLRDALKRSVQAEREPPERDRR